MIVQYAWVECRDGLIDGFERIIRTRPDLADSDGDGVSDGVEFPLAGISVSAHEETVLRAEAPYIKGNGKLGTSSRFYASIDNLSFSLQLARKRFGDFVFCSKQDARWNSVLVFVDIRNRLTHPKRIQDLEISEKEVRALNEAQDWLREAFKSVFKHPAMVHAVKQHADVSKLRGEDQGSSFD